MIATLDIKTLLDPMRDPAWRADRVDQLIPANGRAKPPGNRDDAIVRSYRKFLMGWRQQNDAVRDRLFAEDPGLYFAHKFRHHPDREWRAILEASLLTRQPNEYIAIELSTCPEAIQCYHDLFYDVRDRLHSRLHMAKIILGPEARRIPATDDVATEAIRYLCYKNFAYYGGPLMLEVAITGFKESTFPAKANQVDAWLDSAFRTSIRRRATTASQSFTVDRWKCMELMQMHVSLLAQTQTANAAGGGQVNEFQQNVEKFFEKVPLAIGVASAQGRTAETLAYEKTAIEPRADEMLALDNGIVPFSLQQAVIDVSQGPQEVNDEPTNEQKG